AVGTGRDDGCVQPGIAQRLEVVARILVSLHALPLEAPEESEVLAVGEPMHGLGGRRVVGRAPPQPDAAAGQEAVHALDGWPPVDVEPIIGARVEGGVPAVGAAQQQLVERLRPRGRVNRGGACEHAFELEHAGVDLVAQAQHSSGRPRQVDSVDQVHVLVACDRVEQPRRVLALGRQLCPQRVLLRRGKVERGGLYRVLRAVQRCPPVGAHPVEVDGHPALRQPWRLPFGTITTGQVAWCAHCWPTEPSSKPLKPPRPREPTTSTSAPRASATRTSAAWPLRRTGVTLTPDNVAAASCQAATAFTSACRACASFSANSSARTAPSEPSTPTTIVALISLLSFRSLPFDSPPGPLGWPRTHYGSPARAITDAPADRSSDAGVVLTQDPQLMTIMLVTTTVGLTMLFSGVKKRRLRWRTEPRERRRRPKR